MAPNNHERSNPFLQREQPAEAAARTAPANTLPAMKGQERLSFFQDTVLYITPNQITFLSVTIIFICSILLPTPELFLFKYSST